MKEMKLTRRGKGREGRRKQGGGYDEGGSAAEVDSVDFDRLDSDVLVGVCIPPLRLVQLLGLLDLEACSTDEPFDAILLERMPSLDPLDLHRSPANLLRRWPSRWATTGPTGSTSTSASTSSRRRTEGQQPCKRPQPAPNCPRQQHPHSSL